MNTAALAHVDIPVHTEDELRAAWAVCRNRYWPDTYEETMKDPERARLVDIVASGRANKVTTPAKRPAPALSRFSLRPPPGYVDLKRRASGERDDD